MKARLLKRLRRKAKKEVKFHFGKYAFVVYSFESKSEVNYDGRIDSDVNKSKFKSYIEYERRNVILYFVRGMRGEKLMKDLKNG